jgi:hypothetical protein
MIESYLMQPHRSTIYPSCGPFSGGFPGQLPLDQGQLAWKTDSVAPHSSDQGEVQRPKEPNSRSELRGLDGDPELLLNYLVIGL